jgi:hypothetical protein
MSISWFSAPFFGYLVRQKLQGDEAVQLYILGLVDHTHPPSFSTKRQCEMVWPIIGS